jgi:5-methylcytosine-specific restriction endonuclease McrA
MSTERHPYRAWYKTARWKKARLAHLVREPLCRSCLRRDIVNDGTRKSNGCHQDDPRRKFRVCDHIIPHRGDLALFWAVDNWQTLCPDCHDRDKQREEFHGFSQERGADGWPIDPAHPSNR